jgi:hypothetical protein
MIEARKNKIPSCPYGTSSGEFRRMRVLENGRQSYEHCGNIVFLTSVVPVPRIKTQFSHPPIPCITTATLRGVGLIQHR